MSLYLLYYVLLSLFYFQSLYFKLLSLLRLWRNNCVELSNTVLSCGSTVGGFKSDKSNCGIYYKFDIKYINELYIVL